jgi:hypothetical protein
MIFIKKILDLDLNQMDANMYVLKRICLRVLFRIYQRHANLKACSNKDFAQAFHAKYTNSFV